MQSSSRMLCTLSEGSRFWKERDQAPPEIVICPFGGACSGAFRGWRTVPGWTPKVSLVTYPGRDERMSEALVPSIPALARSLALALANRPPSPRWILLGHSMGALIAFETCHRLEACGRGPSGLVLSASHAPHLTPRRLLSQLDDDAFVRALLEVGGCPPQLAAHAEFRELYLPMLRSDFLASERYHCPLAGDRVPLATPTLLFYGQSDREASRYEVSAWRAWLRGPTELREIEGDHFYITERASAVIEALTQAFPSVFAPRAQPSASATALTPTR